MVRCPIIVITDSLGTETSSRKTKPISHQQGLRDVLVIVKKWILTPLLSLAMFSSMVGCGAKRGLTVDPPVDPVFINGTSRVPSYPPRIGIRRPGRASTEPWTVSNLSNRWRYIIVHHSATASGGAKRFDAAHKNKGWDELGYHFVIGNGSDTRDGQIEVGGRWRKQKHGAHCRVSPYDSNEYNEHGIGICLVGDFTHRSPSRAQMRALINLTKGLLNETHLPASAVHYHKDFDSTECPGRYFPYREFERAIRN